MNRPMLELTMEETPVERPDPPGAYDAMTQAARRKLNAPESWEWYTAEVIGNTRDVLLKGGIPSHPEAPRGNRRRWQGVKGERVVVTEAERAAARDEYERATGKCAGCQGHGQEWAGTSVERGSWFRTCSRCKGCGAAVSPSEG
jgi:hypothetical protein